MTSSSYPGIYQRPQRSGRGALGWAVTIVGCLLVVALVVAGLWWYNNRNASSTPAPSRQAVQAQAIVGAQKVVSGVVNVTCVMPTAWTPGDTFTCYGYGSSGRELAQMRGTVLPSNGAEWQMNTVWVPLG